MSNLHEVRVAPEVTGGAKHMRVRKCGYCGRLFDAEAEFCGHCWFSFAPDDFVDVDETKAFIHGYTNEDRRAKQK
jgi:hypothetical protein